VGDIETGIDKPARQISTTIDWAACLGRSAGAAAVFAPGPGAISERPRPRPGGISHAGWTPGMAATCDGLTQRLFLRKDEMVRYILQSPITLRNERGDWAFDQCPTWAWSAYQRRVQRPI
jgi:hypothetical protein